MFLEQQSRAPRQGPGSLGSMQRVLAALPPLPDGARIFDLGCGTGGQTLDLARLVPTATIEAVELLEPFVDVLRERIAAAGLGDRITPHVGSMLEPPCADPPADLVWCEGAIYNVGVSEGLEAFRELLKPGGCVAFSEVSWLADPPGELRDYWVGEYPGIRSVEENRERVRAAGYELLADFPLPLSDWFDEYYAGLDAVREELAAKYADDAEALETLGLHEIEAEMLRRFGDVYGYVFYVAQKRD